MRLLRYFSQVVGLFLIFVFFILPIIMTPLFYELPYLHYLPFWQRVGFYFFIFSLSYVLIRLGAKPENRKAAADMVKGLRNQIAKWLGFCLFIIGGADSHANIMGLLVLHTVSTLPYHEEMRVDEVKYQGSRAKSIHLILHSEANGKTYYLTLARKLFDYPRVESGDKLMLNGQQNVFGVYVEQFEWKPM